MYQVTFKLQEKNNKMRTIKLVISGNDTLYNDDLFFYVTMQFCIVKPGLDK